MDFTGCNSIIPIFHRRKHKKSTTNNAKQASQTIDGSSVTFSTSEHLSKEGHSKFTTNVLFYIAGYIVSKLIKTEACPACKKSLLLLPKQLPDNGHNYTSTIYHEAGKASSFTTFVNLKKKIIVNVFQLFSLESTSKLFTNHEDDDNKMLAEHHGTNLMKRIADKYFTLRLFNFGKKYVKDVVNKGK